MMPFYILQNIILIRVAYISKMYYQTFIPGLYIKRR
jgi:hypothetical protein